MFAIVPQAAAAAKRQVAAALAEIHQ